MLFAFVVVVAVAVVVVETALGSTLDVDARHKVSFGNEIPNAVIRQSNVQIDKKLKEYENKDEARNLFVIQNIELRYCNR